MITPYWLQSLFALATSAWRVVAVSALLLFSILGVLVLCFPLLVGILVGFFLLFAFPGRGKNSTRDIYLSPQAELCVVALVTVGSIYLAHWWFTPFETKADALSEIAAHWADGNPDAAIDRLQFYLQFKR
jgi:hypothetical protein